MKKTDLPRNLFTGVPALCALPVTAFLRSTRCACVRRFAKSGTRYRAK